MHLHLEQINPDIELPKFSTEGSVGLDLFSREEVVIAPGKVEKIPLNIKVKFPERYYGRLYMRSSLPLKKSVIQANCVGIIDNDYREEICLLLLNVGEHAVAVNRGEKVAQLIIDSYMDKIDLVVAKVPANPKHTGFGSTDTVMISEPVYVINNTVENRVHSLSPEGEITLCSTDSPDDSVETE